MKRKAVKGKHVLLWRGATFVAKALSSHASGNAFPAGHRACLETPQEQSDEEAQAAPR